VDAFGVDFADAHGLWPLLNTVQQVAEAIDNTEMTAGSVATVGSARIRRRWSFTSPSKWRRPRTFPAQRRSRRNSKPAFPRPAGRRTLRTRTLPLRPSRMSPHNPGNPVPRGLTGVLSRVNSGQKGIIGVLNRINSVPR
jgi:hypothetical protein